MASTVNIDVALPPEFISELDARVGEDGRSELIASLVGEWLRAERSPGGATTGMLSEAERKRRADVIMRFAGSLKAEDHPEWATEEGIARWADEIRGRKREPDVGSGNRLKYGRNSPEA